MFGSEPGEMLWIVAGAVLAVASLGGALYVALKPARSNRDSNLPPEDTFPLAPLNPSEMQPGRQEGDPTYVAPLTEVFDVHREMVESGRWGRRQRTRKLAQAARSTTSVVESHTEMMEAYGKQRQSFWQNLYDIGALITKVELQPKQAEAQRTELDAEIEKNKFEAEQYMKQREDLHKPPPAPETKKPDDPVEALERRWRAELKKDTAGLNLCNKLHAELEQKYKDDPETLRVMKDRVDRLYEKGL